MKIKIKSGRPEAIHPGDRYGMLVVVERVQDGPRRQCRYKCQCDCGNEVIVLGGSLRTGKTKSCGCLRRARMRSAMRSARQFTDMLTSGD